MATNVTTLPQEALSGPLLDAMRPFAEIDASFGPEYSNSFRDLTGAYIETINYRIGPEPGECRIRIPVAEAEELAQGFYGHSNYRKSQANRLSPIQPDAIQDLFLYRKVKISTEFEKANVTQAGIEGTEAAVTDKSTSLFIGYITELQFLKDGQEESDAIIVCQDARMLMKKTPVQGVFHNDGGGGDRVYIRDSEIVFNANGKPNRYHSNRNALPGASSSDLIPAFCREDLNRFKNDGQGTFVDDRFAEEPNNFDQMPDDFARKWLPGHVINYMRNMLDKELMESNPIYNKPASAPGFIKLPPFLFDSGSGGSGEIEFKQLSPGKGIDSVEGEFFKPRAFVGAPDHEAVNAAVSSVGEYNPTGDNFGDAVWTIIRRTGNFSLAMTYGDTNSILEIIRTSQPFNETAQASAGLGDKIDLFLSDDSGSSTPPDVVKSDIKVKTDAYYNRFHLKGGLQWVQVTWTTFGNIAWNDFSVGDADPTATPPASGGGVDSVQGFFQTHAAYDASTPDWTPILNAPTLKPAWSKEDQRLYLATSTANLSFATFPQVFREYVVDETVAFVDFFAGLSTEEGFSEFFKRERPAMNQLLTSLFDVTLGLFKSQRQKFPISAWRSFFGIPIDEVTPTPNTANGEVIGAGIRGFQNWFKIPTDIEILTNPLRVRFSEDARQNTLFQLEKASSAVQKTPMTWNGVADILLPAGDPVTAQEIKDYTPGNGVRNYDIMVTFPIAVDENVWNLLQAKNTTSVLNISQYGPPLELYRNDFGAFEEHRAYHSVVDLTAFSQRERDGITHVETIPEVTDDEDDELFVYRDDQDEIQARVELLANRHVKPDIESIFTVPFIDLTLRDGMVVKNFVNIESNGRRQKIPVNALITEVMYDFALQQTILNVATIR